MFQQLAATFYCAVCCANHWQNNKQHAGIWPFFHLDSAAASKLPPTVGPSVLFLNCDAPFVARRLFKAAAQCGWDSHKQTQTNKHKTTRILANQSHMTIKRKRFSVDLVRAQRPRSLRVAYMRFRASCCLYACWFVHKTIMYGVHKSVIHFVCYCLARKLGVKSVQFNGFIVQVSSFVHCSVYATRKVNGSYIWMFYMFHIHRCGVVRFALYIFLCGQTFHNIVRNLTFCDEKKLDNGRIKKKYINQKLIINFCFIFHTQLNNFIKAENNRKCYVYNFNIHYFMFYLLFLASIPVDQMVFVAN